MTPGFPHDPGRNRKHTAVITPMVAKRQKSFAAPPQWSHKIAALRRRLALTQAEFGDRLRYSAMAVSRWERGTHEPVSSGYIGLGNLAGAPDCWFFWHKAGLAVSDLMRSLPAADVGLSPQPLTVVAAGVHKKLIAGVNHDLIALPVLSLEPKPNAANNSVSFEDAVVVSMMAAPREWCSNPGQSRCLQVKGTSMSPLIRDGDIIAIDASQTDMGRLKDKIVVVSHADRGLIIATLRRFRGVYVLEPESREFDSFPLEKGRSWHILGKVLWWLGKAP